MWQTLISLCLALSGKAASRPAPRRRPAFRRSSARPRLEALEARCVPSAPGTLDTSFGSGGIVTTSFGSKSNDSGSAVVVQTDGKVVAAGITSGATSKTDSFDVVRYNSAGTLDSTFGTGGKVMTPFPAGSIGSAHLLLQPDGKILLGGTASGNFELIRYTSSGSLDTTFGGTGKVSTAFTSAGGASLFGVALESVNGITDIVAAGTAGSSSYGLVLARYSLTGSLDTSFGNGGQVVTTLAANGSMSGLAIQGDGQIIVAGTQGGSSITYLVARYGTSGNLDPTFGSGGVASSVSGGASAVIVQPDGKIVAGGRTYDYTTSKWHWSLERLNGNGSLDPAFGGGGLVMGPSGLSIRALAIQANGKLVATGDGYASATDFNTVGFHLVRFNPDGSLDTAFGTGGLVTTVINGGGGSGALALQADGKIIAAGSAPKSTNSSYSAFALARYWGDPVPVISSYTASPNPVTSGTSTTLAASNITDANSNSTVTQVAFYLASSNGNGQLDSNDTLLGYATQTSPGVWTFTFTVNLPPGTYTIFAQAEDSLGIFSYADALTLTVQ
jgi:uncharacterized delta-60 repeat protein